MKNIKKKVILWSLVLSVFMTMLYCIYNLCKPTSQYKTFLKGKPIWSSYFSNNSQFISVGYENGLVQVYDTLENMLFESRDSKAEILFSLFSFNDSLLLTANMDSTVSIYSMSKKKLEKKYRFSFPVHTAMFLKNSYDFAVCGPDSNIRIINYNFDSISKTFRENSPVNFFWFSERNKFLVTACENGNISFWDLSLNSLFKRLYLTDAVKCVYISEDNKMFVACGKNGFVKVFDFDTKNLIHNYRGNGNKTVYVSMINKENTLLASSNESGQLLIYKIGSIDPIFKKKIHNGFFTLHFNTSGSKLITGSVDGTYKIWDTRTWKVLKN